MPGGPVGAVSPLQEAKLSVSGRWILKLNSGTEGAPMERGEGRACHICVVAGEMSPQRPVDVAIRTLPGYRIGSGLQWEVSHLCLRQMITPSLQAGPPSFGSFSPTVVVSFGAH